MKMIEFANEQLKALEQRTKASQIFEFADPEQVVVPFSKIQCVADYHHAYSWVEFKVEKMFRIAEREFENGAELAQFSDFLDNFGMTVNLRPDSTREELAAGMRRLFGVEAFEKELEEQGITSLPELEESEIRDITSWLLLSEPYDPATFELTCEILGIDTDHSPQ